MPQNLIHIDYNQVKVLVEGLKCPVHHIHPSVNIEGAVVRVIACCEPFREEAEDLAQAEILRQIDEQLGL